ncbi:MAG: cobyric acid synthase [Thermodesulfobacteriota bacterium]
MTHQQQETKTGCRALMFLGTGSDVGKSIAATAFCRILKRRGYRVAPFKAQNMSNNSYVTVEGGEIGRAQVVQAEAAGLLPSVDMNPILLKPSIDSAAQVVILGKVYAQLNAVNYHELKPRLQKAVMQAYDRLALKYDVIVLEGAGSCCEMNLKKNDLVNFPMAKAVKAPCILVGDIDRGGIFAQLIGSYSLMTPREKELTAGFLINKFRGDRNLFATGVEYIEKRTRRPILGVVPFFQDITIDKEDSVAVQKDHRAAAKTGPETVNIAVLQFPAISNFTDMEALEAEPGVVVNYLSRPQALSPDYDALILPGTKNVMEDAAWLRTSGWRSVVRAFLDAGRQILGICGGYQLMGETIKDPLGVESQRPEVEGLGILPVRTTLERDKVVRRVIGRCLNNNQRVAGYEIHMGRTRQTRTEGNALLEIHRPRRRRQWLDGWSVCEGLAAGTYLHGILDEPGFRGEFLNRIRRAKRISEKKPGPGRRARFRQYDRLADHFEAHCDVGHMEALIQPFPKHQGSR